LSSPDLKTVDILLNASGISGAEALSFNGEYIPSALRQRLSAFGRIFIWTDSPSVISQTEGIVQFTAPGRGDVEFWKSFFNETGSYHCAMIYADSPFLDAEVIADMAAVHLKYSAEYTYSENLPDGLTAEIFSKDLIDAIPDMKEKTLPLTKVIKSNINHFDVEIYYRDPDLRGTRVSFRASNSRDRRVMERALKVNGKVPAYSQLKNIFDSNPEILYNGPSYIEVEPCGRCDLSCIFCYRGALAQQKDFMDPALFTKILTDMREFGLPYSICFGGSGEPLSGPSIYAMLTEACAEPLVETVVVETNGLSADGTFKNFLMNEGLKVKTILNINGFDSETYTAIHGGDHFDAVYKNAVDLSELNMEGERVYIQLMKINETEKFTDRYYDFWEKHKLPIIFQKQNTYHGRIPDRTYSDLSPIERTPCWHLQRDLFISADGAVAYCSQDIDRTHKIGMVPEKSLKQIFDSAADRFISNRKGIFPARPDCANCGEWYVFNL
jgi:spiro-SPASM protein